MLRVRRHRYRMKILQWAFVAALGTIIFLPKIETLSLPELGLPFVSSATATEAQ